MSIVRWSLGVELLRETTKVSQLPDNELRSNNACTSSSMHVIVLGTKNHLRAIGSPAKIPQYFGPLVSVKHRKLLLQSGGREQRYKRWKPSGMEFFASIRRVWIYGGGRRRCSNENFLRQVEIVFNDFQAEKANDFLLSTSTAESSDLQPTLMCSWRNFSSEPIKNMGFGVLE
ncbi:unnamed protein product [Linum trigynum]|uniref:Uncharacterized protein n=1 Tax=Linum trigynum TaxID=586398 RepID=A0AAV2FL57_9ROSI